MDMSACPDGYKKIYGSDEYFYEIFNKTRSQFPHVKKEYIDIIKFYSDPYLQHIALYLIENYLDVKKHLEKDSTFSKNTACDNLNRWFDERKNIFTFSGKCESKVKHWDIQIEQLWKNMQADDPNHTCIRYTRFTNTADFPYDMKKPICYKSVPEDYICYSPKQVVSATGKTCPKSEQIIVPAKCPTDDKSYVSSQVQTQAASDSFHSTLPTVGLSVGSTLFGTGFLLFFLYKFTPLVSWLYNRRINNTRYPQYFMEDESFESYEGSSENAYTHSNNERNYIHYHSS
ncbi:PIR protein [Plasmodium ovale]|uniref:PIR Superfamily Protein n=2 Tax=Plasmodium ovale TaxID=36330 RepID=A0A1A8WT52_PLAOA|nr:PIR Superfamily Protein [Plasmodium ovale curtisi]SBT01121.1 PIR Superfamily Protein [Plasmodium ovale curtisi]SBT84065.1 PIR protein [Plasmodium ovale]